MAKYNCLIIDDDKDLNALTVEYLTLNGITALGAADAKEAMKVFSENSFDSVLLDINLGRESGYDVCTLIREKSNVPIVFCSCRRGDDDILRALCLGGDDYITKPYSFAVLTAKIRALLRRHADGKSERVIEWNCFKIDKASMSVLKNGVPISLSATEFDLFCYLAEHNNKVIEKNELLKAVWGNGYYSPDTLNVYVRKLREKIENKPESPEFIKTVWGVGYVLRG